MKTALYNILFNVTDRDTVIERCSSFFRSDRVHTLFFLNAHCFNVAQENPQYLQAINQADLLLNDGIGIKLASFFKGIRLKDNLNGTDLIPEIIDIAEKSGIKVYLLGGKEYVAERAVNKLKQSNPELLVAGYHSGYFSEGEKVNILKEIRDSGTGLVIIGMGVPKQELWAAAHKDLLPDVKLIVGGGAILDFISGEVSRAPLWMRKMNIEWVYRLYLEPRRLWKRYVLGSLLLFYHLFRLRRKTF